jgi:hypothetical protein
MEKYPDRVPEFHELRRRISEEYRDYSLALARQELEEGRLALAGEFLRLTLTICERIRQASGTDEHEPIVREFMAALGGPGATGGVRDAFETRLREAEARAQSALAQVEELGRTLDDRDRLIDAMARTRVWRTAQKWWSVKHVASQFLKRS